MMMPSILGERTVWKTRKELNEDRCKRNRERL